MIGAFRAPVAGMMANQQLLDVISNNLANINTPGFKQNRAVFQDLIYQKLAPTGQFGSALLSDADPARELADELGTGVKLSSTPRSFAPGSLIQDGDPLHVAIEGEGFFV